MAEEWSMEPNRMDKRVKAEGRWKGRVCGQEALGRGKNWCFERIEGRMQEGCGQEEDVCVHDCPSEAFPIGTGLFSAPNRNSLWSR